jgi:phosphoglycerate dehydrogenase-like enzyme
LRRPVRLTLRRTSRKEHGIEIVHTGYWSTPTIEMTWVLILASQLHLPFKVSVRSSGWQQIIGGDLHGRTLSLLGLGNIGSAVARIGVAFRMRVIGQNLTSERAEAVGADLILAFFDAMRPPLPQSPQFT